MPRKIDPRELLRRGPCALAIVAVLSAYVYFGSGASWSFRRIPYEWSFYASLAEGFFRGQVHLPLQPDPKLMELPNPWDYNARSGVPYLWDASYLNGKYYLYFSPLPALLFQMPYKLIARGYPSESLCAAFFTAWAFLACVAFARRALAGRQLRIPMPIWILLIGFGNVATFLLIDIRIYEVAILAATAMTATWAYALLRFSQAPTMGRAVWLSVWLALSIAARPNLGLLLFVTAGAMFVAVKDRRLLSRMFVAALIPLSITALALFWFNWARFKDPLEFGHRYQLTATSMEGKPVCRLCTFPELARFFNSAGHYIFWAPTIQTRFPFVDLQYTHLESGVSYPGTPEENAGVFPLVPLTMVGTILAILMGLARQSFDVGTRVALQVMLSAWMILFGVATCWWVVTRYDMDYMMLMTTASVVCIETGLQFVSAAGIRLLPLRIGIAALALFSIIVGFLLGFVGQGDAFSRLHPKQFERIYRWFHDAPPPRPS